MGEVFKDRKLLNPYWQRKRVVYEQMSSPIDIDCSKRKIQGTQNIFYCRSIYIFILNKEIEEGIY